MLLYDQLIKLLLSPISYIQQNRCIANHLLFPRAADIYRASRQMVAICSPSSKLIYRWRTIPRVNNNRLNVLRGLIILPWLQTIQRVITIPQILQPILANPLKILNRHMRWNVSIRCNMLRLRQLPEHKVLREFRLLINF